MTQKSEIGKIGEDIACEYLVNKKYKICERNFRKLWGELDIIAKTPDGILAFIEVKTLRQAQGKQFGNSAIAELQRSELVELLPEENLTASKLKKLKRTSSLYAGYNPDLIDDKKGWRIDLIAITIYGNSNYKINHYENI